MILNGICANAKLIRRCQMVLEKKVAKTGFMEEDIRKLEIRYKREMDENEAKYVTGQNTVGY